MRDQIINRNVYSSRNYTKAVFPLDPFFSLAYWTMHSISFSLPVQAEEGILSIVNIVSCNFEHRRRVSHNVDQLGGCSDEKKDWSSLQIPIEVYI